MKSGIFQQMLQISSGLQCFQYLNVLKLMVYSPGFVRGKHPCGLIAECLCAHDATGGPLARTFPIEWNQKGSSEMRRSWQYARHLIAVGLENLPASTRPKSPNRITTLLPPECPQPDFSPSPSSLNGRSEPVYCELHRNEKDECSSQSLANDSVRSSQ
jgi:hypothetical protein